MLRRTLKAAFTTLIALTTTSILTSAAVPADGKLPLNVQRGLEGAMKSRIGALLAEKNDKGENYKRGSYSKSFKKIDEATYQGSLTVDTALGTDVKTERFLVTLKSSGERDFSIAGEELKDTYQGLHRGVLGDEACERFDAFKFAREGLTITAGQGYLCKDFYQGEVNRIIASGANLSYQYEPPVPKERRMHGLLRRERQPELVFQPEYVSFLCEPRSCASIYSASFTRTSAAPESEIGPVLTTVKDRESKEVEKNRKENPFFGFRRPAEPERKFWSVALKKAGVGEHWLWMTHDSYDGREVSVGASGFFGPIFSYHSAETLASGVDPAELERRPDADARDYDLVSLQGTVEMGFGDGELLTGDIVYGMTTKRELREVPFGIARIFQTEEKKETKNPRMFINSIQDAEGNELTWTKTGAYTGLVVLPKSVPVGALVTLRLQFENQDSIYKLTPTFSYVDRGGWLPFVRFSDMIHKFDLTVKVPSRYKTLGIGRKVSETVADGASISRWTADSPVTFPTVIFGQYYEENSGFKAKKKDGTEIPVTVHFDKDFMGMYEITPKSLKKFADDAANALNLFREVFGIDYPFSKLDLVNDPLGGFYGQAPSSLIYLGSAGFIGKGITAGAAEGGANISKFVDSLVAHEVAHQWWGSLVANANFRNYWFVESLAEYSSALFIENVYGKQAYQEHIDAWRREVLENDMRASVQDGYTVWGGPGGFGSYRAALYAKGPYAFHIMRATWGDEKFFPFLKTLAQELGGKEIVTRDIQKIAEKSFGANLDWFFDQWLRGVGLPQFTFTYKVRKAEDGSEVVEGEIEQRILVKPATAVKEELEGLVFKGIVPITIIGKSGKEYRKKIVIENAKTPFKFNLPEKPKEIVFNKYGEALGYDVVIKEGS